VNVAGRLLTVVERSAGTGAGPGAFVGPSVQFDSRMVVMSQIKILSPMIIIASACVPFPRLLCKGSGGVSADLPNSSIVGPRAD
jgi:hypothetical protein